MNVTLGDNGILTKVQQAKENIEIVQLEEGIKLNQLYIQMDSIIDEDINFSKNKFTKEFNFKSFTWGSDMTFEIDSNIIKVDGDFSTGNGGKFSIYGYKKSDNAEVILLDTNPSKTDNVNKTLNTNINVSNYSAIRFAIGPATFVGTISLSGEENIDSSENKLIKEFSFQPFTWGSNTTFEIDSNILNINGNFSTGSGGNFSIYGYKKSDNTMVTLLDANSSGTNNVNKNISTSINVSEYSAIKLSIGPATFEGTIDVSTEEEENNSVNKFIGKFDSQPFTWGSNTTFEINSNILNINGNFSTSNAGSLYIYGYQKTDNTMITLLDTNPSKTGNVNENINKNIDVSNYNALKISIGPATFKGTISVSDT